MTKTTKNNGPKAKTSNQQHRVSAPIASSSIIGPSSFSMKSLSDGVVRFQGHEILGQVVGPSQGPISAVFDLNPACWTNSRLSRIASTYEKYRYDKFTIRYHPYVATTATGVLATYIELEIEENAATTVTAAMNHQYAAMGPVWAGHELTYRRPPQDPTTYILTDKGVGNRNDMSQGKVVVVAQAPSALYGYLTVEYDVVFMYPELETGYPGEQFELSSASIPVLAANSNILAPPAWTSAGVKVAEAVLVNNLVGTQNAAGNVYDFLAGSVLYTAWDGVAWLLYENVESALALVNPLRTIAGFGAGYFLQYYVRRLVKQ